MSACPACGRPTYQDLVGFSFMPSGNRYCACGWEEGGPDDFGFAPERDFAPGEIFDGGDECLVLINVEPAYDHLRR